MTGDTAPPMPNPPSWLPGAAPVAVVLITLNEAHQLDDALANLKGWAQEVFVVDSYSTDDTVSIALRHGVHVVQRRFRGFGDQWNFALRVLPVTAPWTMKLDPDERLTESCKTSILAAIAAGGADGFVLDLRLFFMGTRLPVRMSLTRVWRTGRCRFSDAAVNEHPLVDGRVSRIAGEIAHLDSPNLEHWLAKQNQYTTAEAVSLHRGLHAIEPRLLGNRLQRRAWMKVHYRQVPCRYLLTFLYHYVILGAWRAGRVGFIWAVLRTTVYRLVDYKRLDLQLGRRFLPTLRGAVGNPDPRVAQCDEEDAAQPRASRPAP